MCVCRGGGGLYEFLDETRRLLMGKKSISMLTKI